MGGCCREGASVCVNSSCWFRTGSSDSTAPRPSGAAEDVRATPDNLRKAVTTFEDTARIARRTFGGAHPLAKLIEQSLQDARAMLRLRTQ